jgi:hypothetical protein
MPLLFLVVGKARKAMGIPRVARRFRRRDASFVSGYSRHCHGELHRMKLSERLGLLAGIST